VVIPSRKYWREKAQKRLDNVGMVCEYVNRKGERRKMKMRPQFNLRMRDTDQFSDVACLADQEGISSNEWILRQMEKHPVLLGARLTEKMEKSGVNAAGAEVASAKKIPNKRPPSTYKKVCAPENPIETDAVGTQGCKVTVSRTMSCAPENSKDNK
jgi:hypothetical protein